MAIVTKSDLSALFGTSAFPAKNPDVQAASLQPGGAPGAASNTVLDQGQPIARTEPAPQPPLTAQQAAAVRQSGLAPLMADLAEALRMRAVPAFVETALLQILAQRRPVNVAPTGEDIKTALLRSGLFSEPPAPADARAAPAVAAEPNMGKALIVLRQALQTWLADSVQMSGLPTKANPGASHAPSPSPLSGARIVPGTPASSAATAPGMTNANIAGPSQTPSAQTAQLPAPSPAATPAAVNKLQITAAPQAVSMPNAQTSLPSPGGAPAAMTDSGTAAKPQSGFLPPNPAASIMESTQAPQSGAGSASQTVAIQNSQTSSVSVAAPTAMMHPGTAAKPQSGLLQPNAAAPATEGTQTPQSGAASAPREDLRPATDFANAARRDSGFSVLPLQQNLKQPPAIAPQTYERAAAREFVPDPSRPGASPVPPPPYRGGPTSAQPPLPPTLSSDASPQRVAQILLSHTEGASSHIQLLRAASQPDQPQANPRPDGAGLRCMFEIPFATPQGTTVAQFEISRDADAVDAHAGPAWRARFSIDIEPIGSVHAQAVLLGEHVWVTLWAERETGIQMLRSKEALLARALEDSAFIPELAFCLGTPRARAAATGQFVDSAS